MRLKTALNLKEFKQFNWVKHDIANINDYKVSCLYMFVKYGSIVYLGSTKCIKTRVKTHIRFRVGYTLYIAKMPFNKRRKEVTLLFISRPKFNINIGYNRNRGINNYRYGYGKDFETALEIIENFV